jgi:hypothetical protein
VEVTATVTLPGTLSAASSSARTRRVRVVSKGGGVPVVRCRMLALPACGVLTALCRIARVLDGCINALVASGCSATTQCCCTCKLHANLEGSLPHRARTCC